MNFSETYRSNVYNDFKDIEPESYRTIISYFEEFETDIRQLEFEEYIEVLIAYVNSLFEVGKYVKHLEVVDEVIEASILKNIKFYKGKDIFRTLLYQKAVSSYQAMEYDRADHILRELLRMNSDHEEAIFLLKKSLRAIYPKYLQNTRAISVLLFLLSAIVICIEVVAVRTLFVEYLTVFESIRNILFISGWIILGGGEIKHRWNVQQEVRRFLRSLK